MASRLDPAIDLSDAEKRDLVALITGRQAAARKYRFLLFEDKREVELVWNGKTNNVCTHGAAVPDDRARGRAAAEENQRRSASCSR